MRIATSSADINDRSTTFSHDLHFHLFPGLRIGGHHPGADPEASELKETAPKSHSWPHPEVSLAQGDEGREEHHRVGAEVVRLEAIEVEKISEELAHRQAESAVEVCPEDHSFAGPGRRHELISGNAEVKGPRDLAGAAEHQDLHLRDVGSLPSATLVPGGSIIPHRGVGRRSGGRRRRRRRGRRRSKRQQARTEAPYGGEGGEQQAEEARRQICPTARAEARRRRKLAAEKKTLMAEKGEEEEDLGEGRRIP